MKRRAFLSLSAMIAVAGCGGEDGRGAYLTPTGTESGSSNGGGMASPTATPPTDLAPIEFEERGQAVTDEFSLAGGCTVVDAEHEGDDDFFCELLDHTTGGRTAVIAEATGPHRAQRAYSVDPGQYFLHVTTGGRWSIRIEQPRPDEDEFRLPPLSSEGEHPDVLGPVAFPERTRIEADYRGESEFVLRVLDVDGLLTDLTFRRDGTFEGSEVVYGAGNGWIAIEATGEWSVALSEQ